MDVNASIIEQPNTNDELEIVERVDIDDEFEIVEKDDEANSEKVPGVIKLDLRRDKYIQLIISATGESTKISSSSKIRLFIGRIYYLPVSVPKSFCTESIKTVLDLADKIDVRLVKNGYACVVPLVHNVVLTDGQRIAIVDRRIVDNANS